MGGDAWRVDVLTGEVEAERLGVAAALELDRCTGVAVDVVDGVVGGPSLGDLPVDGGDDVAGPEARFLCRRSGQDANEHDLVGLLLHGGADPGELAAEEALVGAVLVLRQVAGELVPERVD